jgi:hypothetical protein
VSSTGAHTREGLIPFINKIENWLRKLALYGLRMPISQLSFKNQKLKRLPSKTWKIADHQEIPKTINKKS